MLFFFQVPMVQSLYSHYAIVLKITFSISSACILSIGNESSQLVLKAQTVLKLINFR